MQKVSADPTVPEPGQGNLGRPEGHMTSHRNNEVLEMFAQIMSENMIQCFLSQMKTVEPEVMSTNQKQEMLAEELASAVVKEALKEAGRSQNKFRSCNSEGMETEGGEATSSDKPESNFQEMDSEIDMTNKLQTHEAVQPKPPQTGLPVLGSLDYPDAPPTTPLLPELEKSKYNFAKKLKGGLAKEFLPSPPPPTPKDETDRDNNDDPRAELMEHLMHSLSGEGFDPEVYHESIMEAFAEGLSHDITHSVIQSTFGEVIPAKWDLHELAQQLAETIITSSLDEAKIRF
ncbi:uncharacterized protein LOC141784419 [Halichoeres trimaculatus]|uniref:uncharacterized protein LOC141784419 n=1 Tax=Halichoeres trimaculatus TaxID=147232 RepID=UPI003D9E6460